MPTLYDKIMSECSILDQKIKTLQNEIDILPKGVLLCKTSGKYIKWYHNDGQKLSYLNKNQLPIAEKLALKKYLALLLKELLHEKKSLELYLSNRNEVIPKAIQLLNESSNYKQLLQHYFKPFSAKVLEWINSPYEQNMKHPENLIHKSISGNTVRSKSEAIIDMALYINKIPYRYECALQLDHLTFYPDFMIYHPQSGKVYYWEHFGMMDNSTYSKDVYNKLQIYNDFGYVPSINLITTFETKDTPLTSDTVEKIIKQYFL